ncbi:hypothetical protein ES332_D09G107100v1 [Gossypium tomentosum]|uniref:Uncharacterized protein n=1 Tax=Gossypium tomentosum TaxID=34277 RepID=A0A5D2JF59_GOSTO|nr:hypothetical protein ES332_D09G107100v1 [Gossypium tomentosum]
MCPILLIPHSSHPPPPPPPPPPSPALPMVDLELHQQQRPPSANETLHPDSIFHTLNHSDFQSPPPHTPPLPQQQSLPPIPSHQKLATAQQHLQWRSAVLSFCFSYPMTVLQFQFVQTDQNQPNVSLVVLSFLILLTFKLFLLALFIKPVSTQTSETLEKVGVLVAAAAICYAIAIPFPLELKCVVFAMFIFFLLLTAFIYFVDFQSPPPHTPPLPQQQPLPPTPSHRKLAAAQQHLQWINAVLSFCFSYPIIMLQFQYAQTDQNQSNVSLIVLSFLVLLTFNLFLLALFIKPISTQTSETLEKVGVLVAAAAFCHTIAIPFPLELKCVVFALFILFLLLLTAFIYFNGKGA